MMTLSTKTRTLKSSGRCSMGCGGRGRPVFGSDWTASKWGGDVAVAGFQGIRQQTGSVRGMLLTFSTPQSSSQLVV